MNTFKATWFGLQSGVLMMISIGNSGANGIGDPFFPIETGATLDYWANHNISPNPRFFKYVLTLKGSRELGGNLFEREYAMNGKQEVLVLGQVYSSDYVADGRDTCQAGSPYSCSSSTLPYHGNFSSELAGDFVTPFEFEGGEYLFQASWNKVYSSTS